MVQEVADSIGSPAGAEYPGVYWSEVGGIFQRVAALAERDALPAKLLLDGKTTCYVAELDRLYLWSAGAWIVAVEDVSNKLRSLEYQLVAPSLPGDGVEVVRDRAGKVSLGVREDGSLIAYIRQGDIADEVQREPGDDIALLTDASGSTAIGTRPDGSLIAHIWMDSLVPREGRPLPGDPMILAADRTGRAAVYVDPDGTLRARVLLEDLAEDRPASLPGDGVDLVTDRLGRVSLGVRADGSLLARLRMEDITPRDMTLPGDPLVLLSDRNGRAALYGEPDGTTRGRFLAVDIADLQTAVEEILSDGSATIEVVQPETLADAFHAFKVGDAVFYLSRQWRGTLYGFEQRGDASAQIPVTLAQSPQVASVVASFGGASLGVGRPLTERYDWHVRDSALVTTDIDDATQAFAAAYLALSEEAGLALPTILLAPKPVGSVTEADAVAGSAHRVALGADVAAARQALTGFGKVAIVDALLLQLLDGAQGTDEMTADFHYAGIANSLRDDIAAEQSVAPFFVVNQTFGTRSDGTSEVILAEGLLEQRHFDANFVIATPLYWCRIEDGTVASLHPEDALLVSELQARAVFERENGRSWLCPRLQDARLSGSTITLRWVCLGSLVLDDPVNHGFAVDGITNGAVITSVSTSGADVVIEMSAPPAGDLTLRYAWGETGDAGDGRPANRGALRDDWQSSSLTVPAATLHRRALSSRVSIITE